MPHMMEDTRKLFLKKNHTEGVKEKSVHLNYVYFFKSLL